MSDTVITVRGSFSGRYAPEHAVVAATVSFDGPERDPVFARATGIAATLQEQLAALHDAQTGPVIRWSAQRARVWSQRPWNEQGRQLPPVYHAQLDLSATFVDSEALARWVETASTTDGVQLHGIGWRLSEESERAALAEVRAAAVTDALERARAFASSLGLSELDPLALADPGMLGDPAGPQHGGMEAMSLRASKDMAMGGSELSFTPEELEISAAVDARFAAR